MSAMPGVKNSDDARPWKSAAAPRRRRARMIFIAPIISAVALVSGLAAASPALAVSPSYTHNNYYSYAGLKNTPHVYSGGVIANLYNDSTVYMQCFVDTENVTDRNYSNYNSPRWFRVQSAAGTVGYVHSSYVYYQQNVGRC